MMVVHTVTEAKARLSELIERAREGEEIIIGKAGKPVVVLKAYSRTRQVRRPGALRGRIQIKKDFEQLPTDIAVAFGIKNQ